MFEKVPERLPGKPPLRQLVADAVKPAASALEPFDERAGRARIVEVAQAQAFRQHGLDHILRDIAPDEFLPEFRDRVVPAAEKPQGTAQGLAV